MNKIGIVGAGFVGTAVNEGFNKNCKKFLVDPKLKTTLKDLANFNPEFIFICVPTPMGHDGKQDSKILINVLKEINELFSNAVVIIKSTVLPNTVSKISSLYTNLVYNPEFLREKTAKEDFINQNSLILGGPQDLTKKVYDLYLECTPCRISTNYQTDLIAASMAKYTINSFLATKVIFFNQLKDIYKKSGAFEDWNSFIEMVSSDSRIGDSHMQVPGHDGRYGFGGACFPKDTSALLNLSNELNEDFSLLREVIKANNKIRKQYIDLDEREKEQKVSYDINLS